MPEWVLRQDSEWYSTRLNEKHSCDRRDDSRLDHSLHMSTEPIETPCIGLCTLDGNGVCRGCRRSFEEIAEWPFMSASERGLVMADLDSRRPVAHQGGLNEAVEQ